MSEILSNENKLSMLINDTMEAMAEVSACKTQANCISLDAGPLQRVWCRPRKLGIPRGHLRGVLRISLWPCQWWTGIHYRWWHPGGSRQRPWHSSEGTEHTYHDYNDDLTSFLFLSPRFVSLLLGWAGSEPTGTLCCGKTDCTSALPPASWLTVASVPLSRYSSTQRRSLESAMLWLVLTSKSDPQNTLILSMR